MDNEKVFLELTRSEALATWEALHAAHRFLTVIDGGDVLGAAWRTWNGCNALSRALRTPWPRRACSNGGEQEAERAIR